MDCGKPVGNIGKVLPVGLNAFQVMLSQMLVAMKREIPEPRPYIPLLKKLVKADNNDSGKEKLEDDENYTMQKTVSPNAKL